MELESMEHEEKLVDLLGLRIVKSSTPNILNILDSEGQKVGQIKRKKLYNKNKKKDLPAVFGYHTVINTPGICYDETRRFDDPQNDFYYDLVVKGKDNSDIITELSLISCYPSLTIRNKKTGYMNFHIQNNVMFFEFRRDTERFHKEECVVVGHQYHNHYYAYNINFCEKDRSLEESSDRTTVSVEYTDNFANSFRLGSNVVKKVNVWEGRVSCLEKEETVKGDLVDAILSHKRGIEAFHHFRSTVNEVLPFEKDIFSVMLEDYSMPEEFSLFTEKSSSKQKYLKR